MLIVDGHCDTIELALDKEVDLEDNNLSFNLEQTKKQVPILQMTAAFINPKYEKPFNRAYDIISHFERQLQKYPDTLLQVKTAEDIDKVVTNKKVGCLLTIENGSAIQENITDKSISEEKLQDNINYLYHKGARVMSITWNEDNLLGCGALTKNDTGLTDSGREYIRKLNNKGIIIDISHASEKTFWDTCKTSERPIVATHSCCYSLCKHPRNLKDEQIKQIAKQGGMIGMCYCTAFLSETEKATTKEIAEHIAYIANLIGIDYIGLGSDFDGLEPEHIPTDLRSICEINNLINALKDIGFNEKEIQKIMGENWLRLLKQELN